MNNFFKPVLKLSKKRELTCEKINIKQYPKLEKQINTFFNDPCNYFIDDFTNTKIVVGKKNLVHSKLEIPCRFSNNKRKKTLIRRKNGNNDSHLQKSLSSSRKKRKSVTSSSRIKRRGFKNIVTFTLKPGQRFINEIELDNLFSSYKEVRKINKFKCDNFMTSKEYLDNLYLITHKKLKGRNISINNKLISSYDRSNTKLSQAGSMNYLQTNINNNNPVSPKSNTQFSVTEKNKTSDNFFNTPKNNNNNQIYSFEEKNKEYNGTSSTGFSINLNEDNTFGKKINKNILNEEKKEIKKINNENKNYIKKWNELIKRQYQYLAGNANLSTKNQLAESLSQQEQAIILNNQNQKYKKILSSHLKLKTKKPINDLLLNKADNYRLFKETKTQLQNIINVLDPSKIYDWEKDLKHNFIDNYFEKAEDNNEILRNPQNKTFYTNSQHNLFLKKNKDYLEEIIPKKQLRGLSNGDIITNNLDSLFVKGKNLLNIEYESMKKMKGRKIINELEGLLSPRNLKNITFGSGIKKDKLKLSKTVNK